MSVILWDIEELTLLKIQPPDPPFISHHAIVQGEMGLFLTFSVLELEFRQTCFGGHLQYFSGSIRTFPLLSVT